MFSLFPVPTEPASQENNGPQMTPITDDNTGLIAGIDKLLLKITDFHHLKNTTNFTRCSLSPAYISIKIVDFNR